MAGFLITLGVMLPKNVSGAHTVSNLAIARQECLNNLRITMIVYSHNKNVQFLKKPRILLNIQHKHIQWEQNPK